MSNFSSAARLRLNIHAWALLVLVIIEVLTNFLSDNLTVGRFVTHRFDHPLFKVVLNGIYTRCLTIRLSILI